MRETNQHLFELGFKSGSVHYFSLVKFEILIHKVIVFLKLHIFYFIFVVNNELFTIFKNDVYDDKISNIYQRFLLCNSPLSFFNLC